MTEKLFENLFVYGPLMSGLTFHESYLGDLQVHPVSAQARGRLVHLEEAGLPVMLDGDDEVVGELVQIPAKAFERLDYFRGVRGNEETDECTREKHRVNTQDGEVEAWIYRSTLDRLTELSLAYEDVPKGDWRAFNERKVSETMKKNASRFPSGV